MKTVFLLLALTSSLLTFSQSQIKIQSNTFEQGSMLLSKSYFGEARIEFDNLVMELNLKNIVTVRVNDNGHITQYLIRESGIYDIVCPVNSETPLIVLTDNQGNLLYWQF